MKNPLMNIKWLAFSAVTMLFAVSCANNDVQGPGVDVISPGDGAKVNIGNSIVVNAEFTDNEALNFYKVQVAGEHGQITSTLPLYDTVIIGEMNGVFSANSINAPVPNGVLPGPYLLSVFGLDESGNETKVDRHIHLMDYTDTIPPIVTLNAPANNASLNVNFNVDAVITDKLSNNITDGTIDAIHVVFVSVDNPTEQHTLASYYAPGFSGAYDPQTEQFLKNIGIPNSVSPGNYHLLIIAKDIYYNIGEAEINVTRQ